MSLVDIKELNLFPVSALRIVTDLDNEAITEYTLEHRKKWDRYTTYHDRKLNEDWQNGLPDKEKLDKAIIDANNSVREFVKTYGVDFTKMKSGDRATLEAKFVDGTETVINLYRTNNARGDRRISIKGIKAQADVGNVVSIRKKGKGILIEIH